jgi:acyl-coenzyme A synthetase/AMP-(fatty) acid ligase
VLLADDAVAEVAVIGVRHRLRGQVPMAVVVARAHMDCSAGQLEHRLGDAVVAGHRCLGATAPHRAGGGTAAHALGQGLAPVHA